MSLNNDDQTIQEELRILEEKIRAAEAARQNYEKTEEAEFRRNRNKKIADRITNISETGNVKLSIYMQISLRASRLCSQDQSAEEARSNKVAVKQGLAALQAYDIMKDDPEAHKYMVWSLSDKDLDKFSLPKDACRTFIDSHIERLNKWLAVAMPEDERNVFEASKQAMQRAREDYIREQKEALGIPHDKKASLENIEKGNALRTMPLDDVIQKFPDLKNEVDILRMAEEQAAAIPDEEVRAQAFRNYRALVAERFDRNEKLDPVKGVDLEM